jgi:glycosyltransferase involved in cell wall biosynthesis
VFFQNQDDRDDFVKNHIVERERTSVTPGYGVNIDHFRPRDTYGENGSCTFLLVARMLWNKGVGQFVEAAQALKAVFPESRFQLLGRVDSGNPSGIPVQTLAQWNAEGTIEYLGEVDDVREVVGLADVVVLPSYYREGVPSALMEAMAMGKPLITTTVRGCRETVVQNKNGLLVPPRDVHALVEAMEFMLRNPAERARMGSEGRRLAIEKFDVRNVNQMLLAAIDGNPSSAHDAVKPD